MESEQQIRKGQRCCCVECDSSHDDRADEPLLRKPWFGSCEWIAGTWRSICTPISDGNFCCLGSAGSDTSVIENDTSKVELFVVLAYERCISVLKRVTFCVSATGRAREVIMCM